MAAYRVRLTLNGPIATPLHSGALFGHLCWAMRYQHDEATLKRWLAELPENPFILSDAFPADCLPRPMLLPGGRPVQRPGEDRKVFTERAMQLKTLRKTAWITVDDFLSLRHELNEARLLAHLQQHGKPRLGKIQRVRQPHNTIDRLTGTTPQAGGLYFMEEDWHDDKARKWDIYVQSDVDSTVLQGWFTQVGEFGFGRDSGLGRGRFNVQVELADSRLFQHTGNRLLSLSHGILSPNMVEPRYKLHTHYGKLGGLYAGGVRSPFKYPLILMRPGATFTPMNTGPFGALLDGVHPHRPEIRHNAWHFCLPYMETAT